MANPEFIEESPVTYADAHELLKSMEKRDTELNYRSNKSKEFLEQFPVLDKAQKDDLAKKLVDLKLTRLKEEHIAKIVDFLPKDANELKTVLQAYPLSLPKKDMDEIIKTVKDFI